MACSRIDLVQRAVLSAVAESIEKGATIDLGDGEEFVANVLEEDFFIDPIDIGDGAVATWAARDVRLLEDRPGGQGTAMAQPSTVAA